jgi:hypothetical protein
MISLDPPFAQEALELGADAAAFVTMLALGVLAPFLVGAFLFGVAMLWGMR